MSEKNYPRVTQEELEQNIVHIDVVTHKTVAGQVLRWAVLTTKNGFAVTGKPSCAVSPERDDPELGTKYAIDNAKDELWALMGYALKEKIMGNTGS